MQLKRYKNHKFSFVPHFHTAGRTGIEWLGFTLWI